MIATLYEDGKTFELYLNLTGQVVDIVELHVHRHARRFARACEAMEIYRINRREIRRKEKARRKRLKEATNT